MESNRWNIKKQFLVRAVLPVIGLGLILTISGYYSFRVSLLKETKAELEHIGNAVLLYYDMTYPGDFVLSSDDSSGVIKYDLEKGDAVITKDYDYIDNLKSETGIDISIYYADTIILTTIKDKSDIRPIGYGCHSTIVEDVLNGGEPHFYDSTLIGDVNYFSYYSPIRNSDGVIAGMLFIGKPSSDLKDNLMTALMPLIIIGCALVVAIGAISVSSGAKMVSAIEKVDKYFAAVSEGNLNAMLHPEVASRKDELGDMARNAQAMQKSLKKLIECDGLTELFNRRYGEKRLNQVYNKNTEIGAPFCLSIVDIDFFKKVNDTYGHEAGDVVLKGVSRILERNMQGKGYVARWGGEEFLLVFEHLNLEDSLITLTRILDEIGASTFLHHTDEIRVTITSGISERKDGVTLNQMLIDADDKLYSGKQAGRNRIVS